MASPARRKTAPKAAKVQAQKVKVTHGGSRLQISVPSARWGEIADAIGDGPDRDAILAEIARAAAVKAAEAREERLEARLSPEGLARMGWMLTGEHDPRTGRMAHAAIREGDFRLDRIRDVEGWVFGPPGAFDRSPEGTTVRRGMVQAGVFSEFHGVYRLLEPTADRDAAIADAERLRGEWLADLPKEHIVPEYLAKQNMGRRTLSGDANRFLMKADMARFPDGARWQRTFRPQVSPLLHNVRDDKVTVGEGHVTTYAFGCDATLCDVIGRHAERPHSRTKRQAWTLGRRDADPRWDTPIRRGDELHSIPCGPYDCVLGDVWGATHNNTAKWNWGQAPRDEIWYGPQTSGADVTQREAFPLATREEALEAARGMAIGNGILEGEMPDEPVTLPLPDWAVGQDVDEALGG